MGRYTENLMRRNKARGGGATYDPNAERLVAAAIIRDGETHSGGFKEHWRVRAALGDGDPTEKRLGDVEGFLTSTGRFVDRCEARMIGDTAGQCSAAMRPLLSSDIDW